MISMQGTTNLGITAPSLADLQPKPQSLGELDQVVMPPQARDLYLEMRSKLIEQSDHFFSKNAIQESDNLKAYSGAKSKDAGRLVLHQAQFKLWLD
jgi:hypothetical protein